MGRQGHPLASLITAPVRTRLHRDSRPGAGAAPPELGAQVGPEVAAGPAVGGQGESLWEGTGLRACLGAGLTPVPLQSDVQLR